MYSIASETQSQKVENIFPADAWKLMTEKGSVDDLTIIDVSTPREYETLHLEGAFNLNIFSKRFKERLDAMDRSRSYLVYCKMGGRSKLAQKLMQRSGFQVIYNLVGGTVLWEEEGLPFACEAEGVKKLSFCPFQISVAVFKWIKKGMRFLLSRIAQSKIVSIPTGQGS